MIFKYFFLAISVCLLGGVLPANAEHGHGGGALVPRIQVIRDAQLLGDSIEFLDEALHEMNVPAPVIQKVHHTEETVMEFRDMLSEGASIVVLEGEFHHITADIRSIRETFKYGYSEKIGSLVWDVWRRYRYLSRDFHSMNPVVEPGPGPGPSPNPNPNPNPNPGPDPDPGPGPSPDPGGLVLGGQTYEVVDGTLDAGSDSVSGTGTLAFVENLSRDDNNFAFSFELKKADAYVTLIANANDELEAGVELSFYRNDDDSFGVELKVAAETYDLSEEFEGVVTTGPLAVAIDVHEHGHLVIELNGGEEVEVAFNTPVKGRAFGLSLGDSSLSQFKLATAKHEH